MWIHIPTSDNNYICDYDCNYNNICCGVLPWIRDLIDQCIVGTIGCTSTDHIVRKGTHVPTIDMRYGDSVITTLKVPDGIWNRTVYIRIVELVEMRK